MARLLLVLVWSVGALAGCKSMGGVGHGFGSVASGLGHVASGVGHVASGVGHVANSVGSAAASGVGRVAAPVLANAAPAAGKVGVKALEVAETVAEAAIANATIDLTPDEPVPSSSPAPPAGDLCLDCPDAGNCDSCPAPRSVP
jgi:DNA polymerase-3 subunit gamma/tau